MIDRKHFDVVIEGMKKIAQSHQNETFNGSVDKIILMRDSFDVKAMVVGHFSAGKSALLNTFLQKDEFLKEDQRPQTAIATELRYAEEEKYTGFLANGNCEKISTPNVEQPEKYDHLLLELPVDSLKQLEDFSFVDTPGFDSGIEKHNKALSVYLGHGSIFLLVISVEKGDLDQTNLDFLSEISKYSYHQAIVISKCDKRCNSDVENVKNQIVNTLHFAGFKNCPVICTSKFDEEIVPKIISLFENFDAQTIFDDNMKKHIHSEAVCMHNSLDILDSTRYLDTYEQDCEIKKYNKLKQRITEIFEAQKKKLFDQSASMADEVIENVRIALTGKADTIAEAILSGGNVGIEAAIVEIIRPVMIASVKEFSSQQLNSVIKAINLDLAVLFNKDKTKNLSEIIQETAGNFKNLIDQGVFSKALGAYAQTPHGDKKAKKGVAIYQTITTIAAILTDVVAPWLEVVIVLLPNIISLCKAVFGESDKEKIRKTFCNNLIPLIVSNLRAPVEEIVEKTQNALLTNLESEVNAKIDGINASLLELQQKKQGKEEEFKQFQDTIVADKQELQKIIQDTRSELK